LADKRKLTDDEIARVHEHVLRREQTRYPGFDISVKVKKKTDDNGAPLVVIKRAVKTKEAVAELAPRPTSPIQQPPQS
jgi:hypothetical protein